MSYYRRALELNPHYGPAHLRLGAMLFNVVHSPVEGLHHFKCGAAAGGYMPVGSIVNEQTRKGVVFNGLNVRAELLYVVGLMCLRRSR
jgi:hypothetical protein